MCAQPMDSTLQFQAAPLLAEPQSSAASQTALSCVSTPKPCKPSLSFNIQDSVGKTSSFSPHDSHWHATTMRYAGANAATLYKSS